MLQLSFIIVAGPFEAGVRPVCVGAKRGLRGHGATRRGACPDTPCVGDEDCEGETREIQREKFVGENNAGMAFVAPKLVPAAAILSEMRGRRANSVVDRCCFFSGWLVVVVVVVGRRARSDSTGPNRALAD